MKMIGVCCGHDVAYAVFENGIPIIHNELERFSRVKAEIGDGMQFLFDTYEDTDDIVHASYCVNTWRGGIKNRFPESFKKLNSIVQKNGGKFWPNEISVPGHHQCHAANAFFSSNHKEALILTIDGGGEDVNKDGKHITTAFTAWKGIDNKIYELDIVPIDKINLGVLWDKMTSQVFSLSGGGPPLGSQAGTVMGMAALGDPSKYRSKLSQWKYLAQQAKESEQNTFDIAASLQEYTEKIIKNYISTYLDIYPSENLCLSGGVALNCVMVGQIQKWFPSLKNVYVDPVPYDAGIALGGPRYIWHHVLDNPRIEWKDNATPYLGNTYQLDNVIEQLDKTEKIKYTKVTDDDVIEIISSDDNVISVYGGGSESGRRALGNRSILADPRSPKMKDIINQKVKHRQWFRPFAPSIMRDEVTNWFERDVNSPYMDKVIHFKEEVRDKVPAVVHFDGSARLQTVIIKYKL